MSDDLISRKAVLNILTEARVKDSILCSPAFLEMLAQRIKKVQTAFDKEKVRRELIELRNEEIYKPDSINKYTEARSQGRYSAFLDALRIVEKGGI